MNYDAHVEAFEDFKLTIIEQEDDCPQVGVGGSCSESYFEGEECAWCGKRFIYQ